MYALEQSVLALMADAPMMAQAAKVERFKASQELLDALYAKYDTATGQPVVADNAWGISSMPHPVCVAAGAARALRPGGGGQCGPGRLCAKPDLLLCRAYRVADYGIWERGDKGNNGAPERNASSIGLVKAALRPCWLDPLGPGDGRHILGCRPMRCCAQARLEALRRGNRPARRSIAGAWR